MVLPHFWANCTGFGDCVTTAHWTTLLLSSGDTGCVVVRARCTIASARLFGRELTVRFSLLLFKSFTCDDGLGAGDGVFAW